MKCKLFFEDGSTSINEVTEEVLESEMRKPKEKRLYKCGIEFSYIDKVEVITL